MRFLLVDKKEGTRTLTDYPRYDKEPVVGLDKNLEYFVVDETNPEGEFAFGGYELTDEMSDEYKHLKIAKKIWNPVEKIEQEKTEPVTGLDIEARIKSLEEMIVILAKEPKERTVEELSKFEALKIK